MANQKRLVVLLKAQRPESETDASSGTAPVVTCSQCACKHPAHAKKTTSPCPDCGHPAQVPEGETVGDGGDVEKGVALHLSTPGIVREAAHHAGASEIHSHEQEEGFRHSVNTPQPHHTLEAMRQHLSGSGFDTTPVHAYKASGGARAWGYHFSAVDRQSGSLHDFHAPTRSQSASAFRETSLGKGMSEEMEATGKSTGTAPSLRASQWEQVGQDHSRHNAGHGTYEIQKRGLFEHHLSYNGKHLGSYAEPSVATAVAHGHHLAVSGGSLEKGGESLEPWQMTRKGYRQHIKDRRAKGEDPLPMTYHLHHVVGALREGKQVPPEVLADYPELANYPDAPGGPLKKAGDEEDVEEEADRGHKLSTTEADYRKAEEEGKRCGTCAHMQSGGTCRIVKGSVEPDMTCDYWESPEEEAAEGEETEKGYVGFDKLSAKIQDHGYSKEQADAVAASIGRKKYGKKKFQEAAAHHHSLRGEKAIPEAPLPANIEPSQGRSMPQNIDRNPIPGEPLMKRLIDDYGLSVEGAKEVVQRARERHGEKPAG